MQRPVLPEHLRKHTEVKPSESVAKLNQLQFDPIQRLVILHDNIEREINNMLYDEDGEPRRKFSQVAYATLLSIQAKISNDLMRYGYARTSEIIETRNLTPEPIKITLTRKEAK